MTDVILALRNATIRGHGEILFEDLNFEIRKGERWAVVGESGDEKTAFLDTVAGKLIVSKGQLSMPFLAVDEEGIEASQNIPPYDSRLVAQVSSQQHFQHLSRANYYY